MEVQAEGGSLEVLGEGGADLLDKVGEAQWGLSERCTLDKAPSYSVWGLGQESVWGVRSVDSWPPAVGLVLTPLLAAPPPSLAFTGQRVTGSHFDSETSKACKALVWAGTLFLLLFFIAKYSTRLHHSVMKYYKSHAERPSPPQR